MPEWVRWIKLATGIVVVVVAWNVSDPGFRVRLRRRKQDAGYYEYDVSPHGYRGGIARFKFMLLGLAMILVSIFWHNVRPYLDWLVPG